MLKEELNNMSREGISNNNQYEAEKNKLINNIKSTAANGSRGYYNSNFQNEYPILNEHPASLEEEFREEGIICSIKEMHMARGEKLSYINVIW